MAEEGFAERYMRLARQGLTDIEIAVQFGVTTRTLRRKKAPLGLTAERVDHSWAIPWTLTPEDDQSREARYLRELSLASMRRKPYQLVMLHTALRWARDLVDADRDITYDGKWREVRADPRQWHLRDLLARAEHGIRTS